MQGGGSRKNKERETDFIIKLSSGKYTHTYTRLEKYLYKREWCWGSGKEHLFKYFQLSHNTKLEMA